MMLGGGLMMGIGLLIMLLVIGLPILLVIALLGGAAVLLQNQNRPVNVVQKPIYATYGPVDQPGLAEVLEQHIRLVGLVCAWRTYGWFHRSAGCHLAQ